MKEPKIIILGIDGATWNIIRPAIKQGFLPNLSKMINNGIWGNLLSTIPPVTAPAWTSFMTGVNPAKHGIFDFAYHPFNSYEIKYLCGGERRTKSIWKILSERGYKVGCFNIPMTYPPETISGFMISGLDTPYITSEFTYPKSLKEELIKKFQEIPLDIHQLAHMRTDKIRDQVLFLLKKQENKRIEISDYLLKKYPVDIFMLVFNATDQVQHHFWHFTDPAHPLFVKDGFEKYGHCILDIYNTVDSCIGWFLEKFPESNFILMSDHGFRPVSNVRLRLNNLLAEAGLLTFKKHGLSQHLVQKVYDFLRTHLPSHFKALLAHLFPQVRSKVESLASLANIDWKKTKAFAWEFCPTSPNIYINLKGRFPEGIVSVSEVKNLKKEIRDLIYSIKDKNGNKIIPSLFLKEEVYKGPFLDLAPDILLNWWEGTFLVESSLNRKNIIRYAQNLIPGEEWSGIHDLKGIFVLYGKDIRKPHQEELNILDLAPIIFSLLHEKIPEDWEGLVPKILLENMAVHKVPKKIQEDIEEKEEKSLSLEEQEEIKKRLKTLGYL